MYPGLLNQEVWILSHPYARKKSNVIGAHVCMLYYRPFLIAALSLQHWAANTVMN
jgi:hypothetical protein